MMRGRGRHRTGQFDVYELLAQHDWHYPRTRPLPMRSWLTVEAILLWYNNRRPNLRREFDYRTERNALEIQHAASIAAVCGVR